MRFCQSAKPLARYRLESLSVVMAGPDPAIHASVCCPKNVDARDKPGHDVVETVVFEN
jgi:hypothetical protein